MSAVTPFRVVYSSDNHGNNIQYAKVVEYALKNRASAVIFGGDLSPKCQYSGIDDYYGNMEREQRAWIEDCLPKLLAPLKGIPVYMILGNGDVVVNYDAHLKNEKLGRYTMFDGCRIRLTSDGTGDYDLVGLPFVNFGWSSMKDFEVHDLAELPDKLSDPLRAEMLNSAFNPESTYYGSTEVLPYHSCEQRTPETMRETVKKGWRTADLPPERCALFSMETFLRLPVYRPPSSYAAKTILVAHAPPFATNADMVIAKWREGHKCRWCPLAGLESEKTHPHKHLGSIAVREYIQEVQPYITLHGHFHESVLMSRRHVCEMKHSSGRSTFIMSSGNDPLYNSNGKRFGPRAETPCGQQAWGLCFDLHSPGDAEQFEL